MKTIITLAAMCLSLVVTTPALAQDARYFQNKTATKWHIPEKNPDGSVNSIRLKDAMDRLAREYDFTYKVAPNTDPAILRMAFNGTFTEKKLDQMITQMVLLCKGSVSFDGTTAVIHGHPLPNSTTSTQPAPAAPRHEGTAPQRAEIAPEKEPAPRASGNYLDQQEKYVASKEIPPAATRPYGVPEIRIDPPVINRIPVDHGDGAIFVPAPPSYTNPWNSDYYSWNYYCPGIGYCGTKVSPRDAQDPLFWARMNGQNNIGYRNAGFGMQVGVGGGTFTPYWGGGAYWGYNDRELYNMFNRDPRYLEQYGMIKINGPDNFLRRVRVIIDGADVTVASKANNKWNQPIVVTAGTHELKFVYEGKQCIGELVRTINIPAAAAHLSLTGQIKPMDFRISLNEFRFGQGAKCTEHDNP